MEKPDVSPGFTSGPLRGCASLAVMATQISKRKPSFHMNLELNNFRQSVEDLIGQSDTAAFKSLLNIHVFTRACREGRIGINKYAV